MLEVLIEKLGAYTVAGECLMPHPTRGQVVVARHENGVWALTPTGEEMLADVGVASSPPTKQPAQRKRGKQDTSLTDLGDLDQGDEQ